MPTPAFPGYTETAPLDVTFTSDTAAAVLARFTNGTMDSFTDALANVNNCAHPIALTGSSTTVDARTGEVLSTFTSADAPLGRLYVPCGNRREHVCPACSRTYARDTFEVIRAGAIGGKTVPASVAGNPLLFVTLTAPSFGLVHGTRKNNAPCRPRTADRVERCPHGTPMACRARHEKDDHRVGAPLCGDCYDWIGAVVWQWHAPELWRRTTIAIRRRLAAHFGISEHRFRKDYGSLQFAKVAEYQARGLVHFHALMRLDGPDGAGSPARMSADDFAAAVSTAVHGDTGLGVPAAQCIAPPAWETDPARVIAWGTQCDIRTITTTARDARTSDELRPEQVAGYVAKYATKDAGALRGTAGRRHLTRLETTCRQLHDLACTRAELRRCGTPSAVPLDPKTGADHYALIGKWAHMLGFRGHFSTRSRRYSITLGQLRRARARWQALAAESRRTGQPIDTRDLERRLLADDEETTTLVVSSWAFAGAGWSNDGDRALALAAADRAREYDQWKAAARHPSSSSRSGMDSPDE